MSFITHGSDLRLAPTLAPVARQSNAGIRKTLALLGKTGFQAVQIDAALPGVRPRELSQSARADLRAVLRRAGLTPAGVDLFIPRKDYLDPDRVDHAMTATLDAIAFAADLGRIPLSLTLPIDALPPGDLADAIFAAADTTGTPIALHAETQLEKLTALLDSVDLPLVGIGIDPAALLASEQDPPGVIHALGEKLLVARLADIVDPSDPASARTAPGDGALDLMHYRVACDLAPQRKGPVVLDLRSLANPLAAAISAKRAWQAAPTMP